MSEPPLKLEAEKIIQELNLLGLLIPHGEARVVGSVALDLIVKRDIDVHVVVESADLLDVVNRISSHLLNHEKVREIRISDYRHKGSMKVAVDAYPGASGNWSVDIWLTTRPETTGFKLVDYLEKVLNPEQREAILRIKDHYYQRGQLRDSMSTLIYKAVVNKDI